MLAKLKVECGFQFTQKLEGMFHDLKISNDTMAAYKKHLAGVVVCAMQLLFWDSSDSSTSTFQEPPPIELSVQILTSTFWPMSHVPAPCTFSTEMQQSCQAFERFYLSRHSGRRLSWQPSLGNADVRVAFKNRKHDLNLSTYALVILLQFESLGTEDFLTYEVRLRALLPNILILSQFRNLKWLPASLTRSCRETCSL